MAILCFKNNHVKLKTLAIITITIVYNLYFPLQLISTKHPKQLKINYFSNKIKLSNYL